MPPKKRAQPAVDFVIRLTGPGIKPWAVPTRNLARVLEATQQLVEQVEDDDEAAESDAVVGSESNDSTLRLLCVRSTSAAYQIAAPDSGGAIRILRSTGDAISDPSRADWSPATLSSIRKLSDVAKALGCKIEFRLPAQGRQLGDVIATIGPATYEEVAGSAFIKGATSIFATIERVGGATAMHCGIRLADQPRMVICRVLGEELVRELGQYIYQDVVLSGEATWLRHNMQLKQMVISSFERPKTGSIRETLRRVYEAGGKAWDKVDDPGAFIAELRRS